MRRFQSHTRRLLGAILIGSLAWSTAGPMLAGVARAQIRQRTVEPFGPADVAKSERQREQVRALARRHLGQHLTGQSLADLDALQRLLDDRHVPRDDSFGQQCLGVVLGDVMAATLRLEWIVVDDDLGRSRALRLRGRDDLFFPITMISKRIRFDEPVDVRALYRQVADRVAALRE